MSTVNRQKKEAFVLKAEKREMFLAQRKNAAERIINRFNAHKPKDGIVNPYKK